MAWSERRRLIGLLMGSFALGACGPEVAGVQDWMMGVFSNVPVGQSGWSSGPGMAVQFDLHEDLTMEVYWTDSGGGVNTTGIQGPTENTWEPRGEDALAFPDPSHSRVEYVVKRTSNCGPFEVERRRTTTSDPPEILTSSRGQWYRGAVCVWLGERDPNPDCHGYCRDWWYDWCDEKPPPCEDDEHEAD